MDFYAALIHTLVFFVGLCVGSFLNVFVDRMKTGESILFGRSHCDHCQRTLHWWELVPILSYLAFGAKSYCCRKYLSSQYVFVEALTGIGFVLLFSFVTLESLTPYTFLLYILSALGFVSLFSIFLTDFKYQIIPLGSLVIAGICAFAYRLLSPPFTFVSPMGNVVFQFDMALLSQFGLLYILPAVLTFLFFWLIWFVSRGKAMGDGDAPLAFVLTLFTGFPLCIIYLYTAFISGSIIGIFLMMFGNKSMKSTVAFGPFLIFGAGVALLYGDAIIHWWLGVL